MLAHIRTCKNIQRHSTGKGQRHCWTQINREGKEAWITITQYEKEAVNVSDYCVHVCGGKEIREGEEKKKLNENANKYVKM